MISNIIIRNSNISNFSIFESTNLFTYFGVLIGFSITIYTFGLSMVSEIKSKIDSKEEITEDKKVLMYNQLISGFQEIKEDIWFIFYSIIVIIFFAIAKEISNPFGWNVMHFKIPETVNMTLFITTTYGMWDIMKTLFNLSEINFELNKKKNEVNIKKK